MKKTVLISAMGLLMALGQDASAHLSQINLGTLSNYGDSASHTRDTYSGYAWLMGTQPSLADTHGLQGVYQFSLAQATQVRIVVTAINEYMDPALSVYAGWMPYAAHDMEASDPASFWPSRRKHPTDSAPNDPNIGHYLRNIATNTYYENPIWNTPDPNGIDLGGLTPAQWYQANYEPHNGYRDTINYTAVGGMQIITENGMQKLVPANYDPINSLIGGYAGQFDAFGDWSMANSYGEWAKISYISSASETACSGPNCVSTTAGGYVNPGHFAGSDVYSETMELMLAAGNYTIIMDGEYCKDGLDVCQFPDIYSSAVLQITAVPIPSSVWLFLTGVVAVWQRKKGRIPMVSISG